MKPSPGWVDSYQIQLLSRLENRLKHVKSIYSLFQSHRSTFVMFNRLTVGNRRTSSSAVPFETPTFLDGRMLSGVLLM